MSKGKIQKFHPKFVGRLILQYNSEYMEQKKRSLTLAALILITALFVSIPFFRLTFFAFTALQSDSEADSQTDPHNAKVIEIHKGENQNEIAKALAQSQTISNWKDFIWLGRLTRQWRRVKAGEYQISSTMTPIEIFSVLTSGISIVHPVTVREGENIYEIADDLTAKGLATRSHFLFLCQNHEFIQTLGLSESQNPPPHLTSLEGYVFPDTYFFDRSMTDSEIIKQMVKHFFAFWGKKEEDQARQLGLTRHQIITLASIIEKETGAPEERALISSVFHNRLKKGMKLQSDPTTIYGIWDRYQGKIHKSDLATKNPYNTYTIRALPIGPIANPGQDAIHAALFPADSPFLYFVSHNDGTHQFSRSFEEHNRAVQKFQLDPLARAGKSWRDHLKQPASVVSSGAGTVDSGSKNLKSQQYPPQSLQQPKKDHLPSVPDPKFPKRHSPNLYR